MKSDGGTVNSAKTSSEKQDQDNNFDIHFAAKSPRAFMDELRTMILDALYPCDYTMSDV